MPVSISLTEDVKTIAELESQPLEILQQVQRTGRPVIVTDKGKPAVVILDAALYERQLRTLNLAHLLAEAEAEVQAKKTRPVQEFLSELSRAKKV
jgi:antitoxin YefM